MDAVLDKLSSGILDVEIHYDDGSVSWFKCTANKTVLSNRGLDCDGIYNLKNNRKLSEEEVRNLTIVTDSGGNKCELDEYINKGL